MLIGRSIQTEYGAILTTYFVMGLFFIIEYRFWQNDFSCSFSFALENESLFERDLNIACILIIFLPLV